MDDTLRTAAPFADDVPLLDLRTFADGHAAERRAFAQALRVGLEGTGFIRVKGHGIGSTLIRDAYDAFETFFSLPTGAKNAYAGVAGGQRGFTPFGIEHARDTATADLKEFFHAGQPSAGEGAYPPNRWPIEVPQLKARAETLFQRLESCAECLLEALALAYELEARTFADMLRGGNSILRAAHYPPLPASTPPGALRAAPHEDINLITLLCEASDSGLQIRTPEGWRPVECEVGQIVVDAGDMLSRLTGGAIPSTTHRVVNPEPKSDAARRSRYSLPFFAHPRPECDLSVLDPFETPERLRVFPPITAGAYLDRRLREIGLIKASPAES